MRLNERKNRQEVNRRIRNRRVVFEVTDLENDPDYDMNESAVPNLQSTIGKEQKQLEIPGIAIVTYTVDFQDESDLEDVTVTVNVTVNNQTYRQTISGWDDAFGLMGDLEDVIEDAYELGIDDMLDAIDELVNGPEESPEVVTETEIDPDYDIETPAEPTELTARNHAAFRKDLNGIIRGLDSYIFDEIGKSVRELGFVPVV